MLVDWIASRLVNIETQSGVSSLLRIWRSALQVRCPCIAVLPPEFSLAYANVQHILAESCSQKWHGSTSGTLLLSFGAGAAPTSIHTTFLTHRSFASAPLWPKTLRVMPTLGAVIQNYSVVGCSRPGSSTGEDGWRTVDRWRRWQWCLALVKLMYSSKYHPMPRQGVATAHSHGTSAHCAATLIPAGPHHRRCNDHHVVIDSGSSADTSATVPNDKCEVLWK